MRISFFLVARRREARKCAGCAVRTAIAKKFCRIAKLSMGIKPGANLLPVCREKFSIASAPEPGWSRLVGYCSLAISAPSVVDRSR